MGQAISASWNKRAIQSYKKSGFQPLKIIKDMELHDDEYKDGLLMAKTKNNILFNCLNVQIKHYQKLFYFTKFL